MNKQNWFYVFLIFAVIMVFSYSFYYFFMRIENKRSEEIIRRIEEQSKTSVTLSDKEIERYLKIVPLKSEINTDTIDAYTNDYVPVEKVDITTLLNMVYDNMYKDGSEFKKDTSSINIENVDYYIKKEDYETLFKTELEKMYHLTKIPDNIAIHVEPYNEYYIHKKDNTNANKIQKISELVSYKASLKELVIFENASFVYEGKIYNKTTPDSLVYTLTEEDGIYLSLDKLKQKASNYATKYKHIYRWNDRKNTFYWYSTEIANN